MSTNSVITDADYRLVGTPMFSYAMYISKLGLLIRRNIE